MIKACRVWVFSWELKVKHNILSLTCIAYYICTQVYRLEHDYVWTQLACERLGRMSCMFVTHLAGRMDGWMRRGIDVCIIHRDKLQRQLIRSHSVSCFMQWLTPVRLSVKHLCSKKRWEDDWGDMHSFLMKSCNYLMPVLMGFPSHISCFRPRCFHS